VGTILLLVIIIGVVLRTTTAEERARFVRRVRAFIQSVKEARDRYFPEDEAFRETLHARTRRAFVTTAILAASAANSVFMLLEPGPLGEPATLVAWGGSVGPLTTNGEWWRLATAILVHTSTLQLLINMIGLSQPGMMLERIVGHVAFGAVYVAAGALAHVVALAAHPMGVTTGASGAVFGVYGLLLALLTSDVLGRSAVRVPLRAVKRLAPACGLFVLYGVTKGFEYGDAAGLIVGLTGGLFLVRDTTVRKPEMRRVAAAVGATMALAIVIVNVTAFPLQGVTDVRPEIEHVIAIERHTASAYDIAVDRFRRGRITAEELSRLIEQTIAPELQAAHSRIGALEHIPDEHRPLVDGARRYFELRDDSWRLRAQGLNRASMATLREADIKERAALDALEKIRPAQPDQ
jgi:membrane associated rhomboid family serine protease